jgi:hypothetical protein
VHAFPCSPPASQVEAAPFAHVLVGVYLTLKTLALVAHARSTRAAASAAWAEAGYPLPACSPVSACRSGHFSWGGWAAGWAASFPATAWAAAVAAARAAHSQASGTNGGNAANFGGHAAAAAAGVRAAGAAWAAQMDSFVAPGPSPAASGASDGEREPLVWHAGDALFTSNSPAAAAAAADGDANADGDVPAAAASASGCGRRVTHAEVLEAGAPDCPICFEALCRPLALAPCGHFFCEVFTYTRAPQLLLVFAGWCL